MNTVSERTIEHYSNSSEAFWHGTKDHDVTQNYDALLDALKEVKEGPYDILDFGCGPGRDVTWFKEKKHRPVGLDGCHKFVLQARQMSGCTVLEQDFLNLDIGEGAFDGIFANASLFHIPSDEMVRVLKQFHTALRPGGVLFSSNPRGHDEGWFGDRYCNYMEIDDYKAHLANAGFKVKHYYYRPQGLPQSEQPWLAVVAIRL